MRHSVLMLLAAGSLCTSLANGQPPAERSSRNRLNTSFEGKSPEIGDHLPDVKAFNAEGESFRLGELKGDYTVLVFGCLT